MDFGQYAISVLAKLMLAVGVGIRKDREIYVINYSKIESKLNNKPPLFHGGMGDFILRQRKELVDNVVSLAKKLNVKLNKYFSLFIYMV